MALELEGRITRKLDIQSGESARGPWSKQEFVVEYQEGNFPTQVCMNVWGEDKIKDLAKYQVGDKVKIAFNLSSREYNGRWYSDIRAWRIEPAEAQQAAPQTSPQANNQPVPPPAIDDFPEIEDDEDLPF